MDSVFTRGTGAPKRRIFWIGDSTVQVNTAETWPQTGMGQALPLFMAEGTALQVYAKNGRSTKSFLDEGLFAPVSAAMQKGDMLLIQFGHNDSKEDAERATTPYGGFTENLEYYADTALKKGALPVFITPLSRRKYQDGKLPSHTHGEYTNAMLALAAKKGLPCINLSEQSRALLEEKGEAATKSWFMHLDAGVYKNYPDGLCDNTHLRHTGAVVFAGLVAQGLFALGGGYKEFICEADLPAQDLLF